jgi:hypothetical protein
MEFTVRVCVGISVAYCEMRARMRTRFVAVATHDLQVDSVIRRIGSG